MRATRLSSIQLVVSIIFLFSGCNVFNKTAEQYLLASQSYFRAGEYTASLIEIKNAIQQDPSNPQVRQFAAKIYLKLGKGSDAEIQLSKAVKLGANQVLLVPLQAQALFQQRKYRKLQALNVPQSLDQSKQSDIYAYQGFAAAELNDQIAADRLYKQSIALNADNRLAYRGIAMLYASRHEYDHALQVVRRLLDKHPQDAELWGLQGDILVRSSQYEKAADSYVKAAGFEKDNSYPYRAKHGLVCLRMDNIECAVSDLSELEKSVPGYHMTAYLKGLLAVKQQHWKDAQSALSDALSVNSELTPAYYFSGLSFFQQKQYGSAITQLSAYVARQPESVNGRHLLSLAQYKGGHLESSKMTLQPIIQGGSVDSSIVYLLGQIEFALGNISNSIHYFKQLSERYPESAYAHAELGLKLMASGDTHSGQDELAVAINIAPDLLEAGQASVLAYLESKQYDKAQALIDKMQVNTENTAALANLQGVLYMQKGDLKQASEFFRLAIEQSPGDPAASHNLARIIRLQGRLQDVIQLYHNVLKYHPQHIPTHLRLAELNLKQGNAVTAEQKLLDLISQQPGALGPRLMLAKYYLHSGRVDSVRELLEPVVNLYPNDQRLLTYSAESLLASGHTGKAKHEAQILVNHFPDSADAHWLLARAAIADRDQHKSQDEIKQTLSLAPEHIPAQIIQIKMLAEKKQLQQARNALQKLMSRASEDPRVVAVNAWMALVTGDLKNAIRLYSEVFSMLPTSANAVGLAQAQWQAGKRENAVATLHQWIVKKPDDIKAQFQLAMFYQYMGLDGDASARFRRVLQFEPDNVVALNNLAWLLRNENPTKALRYIERAAELEPGNAPVLDTLGVVLLAQGNKVKALRVLEKAAKIYPDHTAIHYHFSQALYRNNKIEQAINVLQHLLESDSDFNEKSQAQMMLRKLKTGFDVSS